MSGPAPFSIVKKPNDLLFFDNLALYYVLQNTPPRVLARVFLKADSRLSGSLLGILSPKQRETVHFMMTQENDDDAAKNLDAQNGLCLISEGLIARGLIKKQGAHFFGVPGHEKVEPG
ncbi:MAG: hypothetical protein K1X70_08000 [Leptospirales bacterium]|jgi:hypothetical protein|nr:hypothetical protein [Leptospirales bacterium]HMZ36813.1 hypothetical protein [Leptospiraceae bacterium]HNE21874.1 hypothetical protein [Leptospiraceae bacterium]HNJ02889.1 hypothetical protein [Leptospiraceae bacterium]HNJ34602.1 hypothetical protein [Leptospiraceae bacterium]